MVSFYKYEKCCPKENTTFNIWWGSPQFQSPVLQPLVMDRGYPLLTIHTAIPQTLSGGPKIHISVLLPSGVDRGILSPGQYQAMAKFLAGGVLKFISLIYCQWLWTGGIHSDVVASVFLSGVSLNSQRNKSLQSTCIFVTQKVIYHQTNA